MRHVYAFVINEINENRNKRNDMPKVRALGRSERKKRQGMDLEAELEAGVYGAATWYGHSCPVSA